jgi:hypothetical protein
MEFRRRELLVEGKQELGFLLNETHLAPDMWGQPLSTLANTYSDDN